VYSTFLEDSDALEELAVALIGDLLGAPPPTRRPPPWLARVQELLHEERTGNLRLMTAARAVGVHPVHLARVFRQWYGCSFTDQVLQMRLAGAARALSTSDAPLAWIAAEYGFADQSHLCRTFRTHVGLTPAAYRRAFRG
jgi:AraC family transcriptional regulator